MTPHEAALLRHVREYQESHGGVSPSYRELCALLGLKSKSGINRIVESLEDQGLIRRVAGRHVHNRCIELVEGVSPALLNAMSTTDLRQTLAHVAGILAARDGGYNAATTLRRVADALLRTPG